jgi:hypothetical protein
MAPSLGLRCIAMSRLVLKLVCFFCWPQAAGRIEFGTLRGGLFMERVENPLALRFVEGVLSSARRWRASIGASAEFIV